MNAGRPPIYLARRSYRARRVIDACRLLPFLGGVLLLIPLLWTQGDSGGVSTSRAIIYLFSVWLLLIGFGALLAARLPHEDALEVSAGDET